MPSAKDFTSALVKIGKPKGRQLKFLQKHYDARARALNASKLAKAAGYVNYRGINLHYGKLAYRLSQEMGIEGVGIELLVDSLIPKQASNSEWVLVMRPQFAKALKNAGWVA